MTYVIAQKLSSPFVVGSPLILKHLVIVKKKFIETVIAVLIGCSIFSF